MSSPTGTPDSLLIIESLRRHVRLKDGLEFSNVDSDFHSGCDRENVYFVLLGQLIAGKNEFWFAFISFMILLGPYSAKVGNEYSFEFSLPP